MKKFIISLVFFILCFGMFNQTIALDTINYKKQEILYKTKLNKTLK
jgi:hypothetical protein